MVGAQQCIIFFTLILIQIQISVFAAQNSGNITVGQSLKATINGSSWLSPSGHFEFGFHQFNHTDSLFLLAIWYAKIPETIIWYANGGNPVPHGSTLTLTDTEGLVLTDPQGSSLWNTSDDLRGANTVSYGFMDDTGSFTLKGKNSLDVVWDSFEHPTDTLLPTQHMEIGGELDSQLSETNFTKGRFQLRLLLNGDLILNTRDLATNNAYGAYQNFYTNFSANPGQKLVYNESGNMFILRKDGSRLDLFRPEKTAPAQDYYQRATLNFDGVLIWYRIPRASISDGWLPVQTVPDNICMTVPESKPEVGSGICGYNSICTLGDGQRPKCDCPKNYSLIDPNDKYGSCKPDFNLDDCEGHAAQTVNGGYMLLPYLNTDWPSNDYERLNPSSEEDCKNSCLHDCFCAAAIFRDITDQYNPGCWKKKGPLVNGRTDQIVKGMGWLKVGNNFNYSDDPINPFVPHPIVKNKHNTLISVLLGGSIFINLSLISAIGLGSFCMYREKQYRQLRWVEEDKRTFKGYSNVHCFSYQELEEATNGFTEELGRGAFGIVYKGIIKSEGPPTFIAVKRLDRLSKDADTEFKTEVNVIGQTHHKNLVRLVGFCKEDDHRLLAYEYMSNGTLADYLFGDLRPSWIERSQIALGIARGLLYLHDECSTQIIHCDIKPENILLDDNHNARISDFGLAKLLVLNQTHTNTAIRGTKGYVAPEWFRNKPVTVKVDVYSFGVLLLEIICCRKNICMDISKEERAILIDWAFDCYQSGTLDSLVSDDREVLSDRQQLEKLVMVSLWCIQEDPSLRPTMRMVLLMLEGLTDVPNPPCPNSFSVTSPYNEPFSGE